MVVANVQGDVEVVSLSELLPRSFDLSLLAKLERLPQIVGTLRKLANEDTAALHLDQPACVLLQRLGRDEAIAFEEA